MSEPHVIKGRFYKGIIGWSFSENSFVKFHGKKFGRPEQPSFIQNLCNNEACYKVTLLYSQLGDNCIQNFHYTAKIC